MEPMSSLATELPLPFTSLPVVGPTPFTSFPLAARLAELGVVESELDWREKEAGVEQGSGRLLLDDSGLGPELGLALAGERREPEQLENHEAVERSRLPRLVSEEENANSEDDEEGGEEAHAHAGAPLSPRQHARGWGMPGHRGPPDGQGEAVAGEQGGAEAGGEEEQPQVSRDSAPGVGGAPGGPPVTPPRDRAPPPRLAGVEREAEAGLQEELPQVSGDRAPGVGGAPGGPLVTPPCDRAPPTLSLIHI